MEAEDVMRVHSSCKAVMHMMFTTRWFLGHFWVFCVWIPVLEDVKFARKVMIYKIQNHVETWSFAFVWGEGPDLWDVSVWQTDTRSGKSILARTDLVQKKNGQTRKPWKITPRKVCAFLGGIWKDVKPQESKTWKLKVFPQLGENA